MDSVVCQKAYPSQTGSNYMYNNAPADYKCPICLGVEGIENEHTLLKQGDLVYRDDLATVFINSFVVGENKGHVIVVPNKHFENIYGLPTEYAHRISDIAKKVSIAMKTAYKCDGLTTRQNNEPAGDQHAFHYHLHIFPRYENDGFNEAQAGESRLAEPAERATFASRLKAAF